MSKGVVPIRKALSSARLRSVELCAGGGGQALGLEAAGFDHDVLVEIDKHACNTLRHNRPEWDVIQGDLHQFNGTPYKGVDLLAGGLPCPPFSRAGKQLGEDDERNLFPVALRLIEEIKPKAIMLENVRGILDAVFDDFRKYFVNSKALRDYKVDWRLLNACDFGVSQLRPRVVFVGIHKDYADNFEWPEPMSEKPPTVGEKLFDLISANGWKGAKKWKQFANEIAPTIVGGSLKHGGPDLGPTRARKAWSALGVDGLGVANEAPEKNFVGAPKLTVRMVARLQGFPDKWHFTGGKTAAYRQVGNAFPPPVAEAVARKIHFALTAASKNTKGEIAI